LSEKFYIFLSDFVCLGEILELLTKETLQRIKEGTDKFKNPFLPQSVVVFS